MELPEAGSIHSIAHAAGIAAVMGRKHGPGAGRDGDAASAQRLQGAIRKVLDVNKAGVELSTSASGAKGGDRGGTGRYTHHVVHTINVLGPLMGFGEGALVSKDGLRNSSIVASEDSLLMCIAGKDFKKAISDSKKRAILRALDALKRVRWAEVLGPAPLSMLSERATVKVLARGEALCEQGEEAKFVAVVLKGSLKMTRRLTVPTLLAEGLRMLPSARGLIAPATESKIS